MLKKLSLLIAVMHLTISCMKQENQKTTDLKLSAKIKCSTELILTLDGIDVLFSPDGKRFLVDSDSEMSFYDTKTWKKEEVLILPYNYHYNYLKAFSPDSKWLATGCGYVQIWEMKTGKKINLLKGQNGPICSLGFSPNGKLLAIGDRWGDVWGWDMTTSTEFKIHTCYHDKSHGNHLIGALTFSPDSKYLVTGSNNADIGVYEITYENKNNDHLKKITAKDLRRYIYNSASRCSSLDISADSKYLAAALYKKTYSKSEQPTGKINIFNFHNLVNNDQIDPIHHTLNYADKVTAAKFTPNNNALIVGITDSKGEKKGKIEILKVNDWTVSESIDLNKSKTDSITVSPDSQFFACACPSKRKSCVKIYSLRSSLNSNNLTSKEKFEADLAHKAAAYKAKLRSKSSQFFQQKISSRPWQKLKNWWNNLW